MGNKPAIFNHIDKNLWIGNHVAAMDTSMLQKTGIQRVVCLEQKPVHVNPIAEQCKTYGIQFFNFPIPDSKTVPLSQTLDCFLQIYNLVVNQVPVLTWRDQAAKYTKTMDLKGIFPTPKITHCIGDIHSDMQLLLTLLLDVTGVLQPKQLKTTCSCGFKPKLDVNARSPDRLLTIYDLLPSCTFEWRSQPDTCVVFLGDFLDRKREMETLTFQESLQGSVHDGEMVQEEEYIIDLLNFAAVLAMNHGSRLIKLLGNHELMNLDDSQLNAEYVTKQAVHDTSVKLGFPLGMNGRKQAFGIVNGHLGPLREKLMCMGVYAMVQVGPALMMHGGLAENISKQSWCPKLDCLKQVYVQNPYLSIWNIHHSYIPVMNAALWKWLTGPSMIQETVSQAMLMDEPTVFWTRKWSVDTVSEKKWKFGLFQSAGALVSPEKSILVVGHCVQNMRLTDLSEKPSYKFILQTHDQKDNVYKIGKKAWYCNKSNLHSYLKQIHDTGPLLKCPWSGVQFQVPEQDHEQKQVPIRSQGQIYMCDCAMSRAFDLDDEIDPTQPNFQCRAPQCLTFNQNWVPEVWISKYHLGRRWLTENQVVL